MPGQKNSYAVRTGTVSVTIRSRLANKMLKNIKKGKSEVDISECDCTYLLQRKFYIWYVVKAVDKMTNRKEK